MKVSVNDKAVPEVVCRGRTLENLIDLLRRNGSIRDDEVVAALSVDSRPWHSYDMGRLGETRLSGVQEVDITTDDMSGYGRRILDDAAGMLQVIKAANIRIAADLAGPDPQRANRDLFHLLDSLQQFLTCVYNVRNACAPQAEPDDMQRVVMALLSAALDTIVDCQGREDWPGLSRQLREHLAPSLESFDDVIAALRSHIGP
ncbi:MAG: hypothetical protein ACTSX8_08845 [Alphaproteobacteria bacterium]